MCQTGDVASSYGERLAESEPEVKYGALSIASGEKVIESSGGGA
jgi:hypothetical protein